jgi:hypothetical protein
VPQLDARALCHLLCKLNIRISRENLHSIHEGRRFVRLGSQV